MCWTGGHLEFLKYAVVGPENTKDDNATVNNVECCAWKTISAKICAAAAQGGHLEVLKWARENGCQWDKCTCANAAGGGHLAVLVWARENGCKWDSCTCWSAARGGHLEVLKWARENGCEWNSWLMKKWQS